MKRILIFLFIATLCVPVFGQNGAQEQIVTFRFVPGDDMFYIPWQGNDAQLNALYALVDIYRYEISDGRIPVYVDSYSASMRSAERNRELAFIRANRVKSELITQKGLTEDNFVTTNHTTAYEDNKDMVVVTLRIPQVEAIPPTMPEPKAEPEYVPEPEPIVEQTPEPAPEPAPQPKPIYSRWSVGANVGMPFFWGDMTSIAHDKTYIGVMIGIHGTYQISPTFGVSLSLDWAQNKAGSRGYATGYLLDATGMTWYTEQPITMRPYGELYSKINMYSTGLHLDVSLLRLFGGRAANGRFKVIASPAVYAQHFSSKIYTISDDKVFVGESLSKDLSVGLGGDLALRYAVSPAFDVQLKGTGIWITDNLFDNIRTVGYVKQNAMWGVSAGVVWKIGGDRNTNLLYKSR